MQGITNKTELGFYAALLLIASVLCFFIFKPYFSPLFLAVIFSIVFRPVYEKLLKVFGGRGWIAAAVTLLILVLLIILPVSIFGFFIFNDVQDVYHSITANGLQSGAIGEGLAYIEKVAAKIVPGASIDPVSYIKQVLGLVVQNLGGIFGRVFAAIVELLLMLLGFFYFLRDGDKFRQYFISLSPLSDQYDRTILGRLEDAINSVVKGAISIAFIQGLLAGIGFAIFGLPNPMLWGAVTALAALIPGGGTAFVIVPSIIYMFFFGSKLSAFGLLLWGVIAVGLIDNVLGPFLIKRGLKLHPFLILLSVLGGIVFFGPVGFLAGPVILALLFALFEIYPLISAKRS